ncbi:unnamed protein product [Mytilus coruscus]|uniref:Uncharacterized protein n=1 Tax=Mytilus coruscus TaxID=42192 RepID=A0A6J8EWM3_MYTCO|nr:unnamed protein product [Mytilus coruscus]
MIVDFLRYNPVLDFSDGTVDFHDFTVDVDWNGYLERKERDGEWGDAVCLECKGVYQPEDCAVVTKCGPHEECSVEEYVTNDGNVLYDVGCKDIARCNLNAAFGRRQANTTASIKRSIGTAICSECCNSKLFPLCNIGGCGIKKPTLPAGSKICYKCPSSIHPDECTQITLCNKNQSCSSQSNSASSPCMHCCDIDVCNDQCKKTTVTISTLKPSTSLKPLTVRSTTSQSISTSTQASTMTPTFTTQTHETTKISTLQTTAIPTVHSTTIPTKQFTVAPTVQSTTIPTKKFTAAPTFQSTTIPTKQMTISSGQTTTSQQFLSTNDTTTHLETTTAYQSTCTYLLIKQHIRRSGIPKRKNVFEMIAM